MREAGVSERKELAAMALSPAGLAAGKELATREAAANRDLGGTLFDSLTPTGGVVATAGLVLDGTVVGAVAGVPLTVIGGAMAVVGSVGKWILGDSKTERLAKKLGYL